MASGQSRKDFINPPARLCNHVIWGWDGDMSKDVIINDLHAIRQKGFRNIIIEPGYNMPYPYLSDGWFQSVKNAVDEAKSHNMKVWIIDEGKYPSGFAGGKFSAERPDLRMQTLIHDGDSVKAIFKTSPTRNVNNPTGKKDESASLCDYLNPKAVRQFIDWTHKQYFKVIGNEFGKTVLGFRGDEPDFGYFPWTPEISDVFKEKKGYDVTPYLSKLIDRKVELSEDLHRIKADYWDVWSRLFADNFFLQQTEWCKQHGVEYITHLNKDDDMKECIRVEGDMFRDLGNASIPGIDVIWNQIWPGKENDFPKLVSSIAHINNKQRAFSESFAAFNPNPNIDEAKYVIDYQIARGINFFEFMFWPSKKGPMGWMKDKRMKQLIQYTDRATWLMTQGKPTAKIALYYPIYSLWMGNNDAQDSVNAVAHRLLSNQYDFDFINDEALNDTMPYSTIIVPSCEVISNNAMDAINRLKKRGGHVLFGSIRPCNYIDTTFTRPHPLHFDNTNDTLPKPEIRIISGDKDSIRYIHRQTESSDIYFIFNESKVGNTLTIDFDNIGQPEIWDAMTGKTQPISSKIVNANTRIDLNFKGWESKIIVITKNHREYDITKFGAQQGDTCNASLNTACIQKAIDTAYHHGGGTIVIPKGNYISGALFFKRGVNLKFDDGAKLTSAVDTTLYPLIKSRFEGIEQMCRSAFLNFINCPGVNISGKGTIDAKGLIWKQQPRSRYGRPKTICVTHCDGGSISDVAIRDQAFWCIHVLYTNGFTIRKVDIIATDYIPSSDGIDIDSSRKIHITESQITAHDDCISIKSGKDEDGRRVAIPSEDILIDNCHFDYGHGGVAMGSEVSGNIRNVTIKNCVMGGENWNPLRLKSQPSRGGIIEDITYENIRITKAKNVFDINMEWRMVPPVKPAYHPLTQLRNICFKNITANAENGGTIHGYKEQPFTKDTFHFDNVVLNVKNPIHIENADIDTTGLTTNVMH